MSTVLHPSIRLLDLAMANAFLVEDDGTLTLVDAGTPFDARRIRRAIAEAGYTVGDVERVLITHYDLDHVGGLGRLDLEAEVYAGRADAAVLAGETSPPLTSRKGLFQRVTSPLIRREADVTVVDDGDTVGSFTAYHTPGHTPGHTVFVSEALSVAVLGDLVRESRGRLEASPWIISADTDAVRSSIRRVADEAPPFDVAAMGHGVPFEADGSDQLQALAARL